MALEKKKGMTRDEAKELYGDLQKALKQMKSGQAPPTSKVSNAGVAKQIAAEISKAMKKDPMPSRASLAREPIGNFDAPSSASSEDQSMLSPARRGQIAAVSFVLVFGLMRVLISALDALGFGSVREAQASVAMPAPAQAVGLTKEEVRILTSLDSRRADLSEKSKKIEDRERQMDLRDREFAVRVAELKELTERLRSERDKNEKKRNSQIEQLANVYGSMSPQEAAQLLEQLDVTIALSLVERMPEKKIGQILALMSKDRALMITKMLSGKAQL